MRCLFGLLWVFALGAVPLVGCAGGDTGTEGTGGMAGDGGTGGMAGDGGTGGMAGDGGTGGMAGDGGAGGTAGGGGSGGIDVIGPRVVETAPVNGATTVAVDTVVVASFDEDLDAATVSITTVLLTAPGDVAVPATVTYADRMATLTPADRLPGNALMTATIKADVQDVAGNTLGSDFTWTFTTDYGTDVAYGAQEFTVRDIPPDGIPDVFVGGTPPPRTLLIKKGTEDRAIVEFDIQRFPEDVLSAQLDFHSHTLDPGGPSTRIGVYRFIGNGVPDLSDFSQTGTLFASEVGANEATNKAHTFDITAELENARAGGVQYLGLLFLAEDTDDRFNLIESTSDPDQAPRLTVTY